MEEETADGRRGAERLPPPVRLAYSVHSTSSHTNNYLATNILEDRPTDQSSRWTGFSGTSIDSDDRKATLSIGTTPRGSKREIQYIVLKLDTPAVVQKIGFGKFHKTHPCNVSEFCIYGGMSPNARYMELLCHGGLKNDAVKETFDLAYSDKADGVIMPVQYIRIDAINAHGVNYNVSIWHVWLEGCNSSVYLKPITSAYEAHRDKGVSHVTLAHLRRSFLLPAFSALLTTLPTEIAASFEHPLLSALHTALVLKGQFVGAQGAEKVLEECLTSGLFREWGVVGGKGSSIARWSCITEDGEQEGVPTGRAGHQMFKVGRKMFLHGGWDGEKDLGDLWECDLPRGLDSEETVGSWRLVHGGDEASEEELEPRDRKRPRPRSCHKVAVDESEGWVYLLGGMAPRPPTPAVVVSDAPPSAADMEGSAETLRASRNGSAWGGMDVERTETPPPPPRTIPTSVSLSPMPASSSPPPTRLPRNRFANDFWRYKAVGPGHGTWELLNEDVSTSGGPKLLSDHQMVMHSEGRMLFVFGGKHADAERAPPDQLDGTLSGMFAYDLDRRQWYTLFGDPTSADQFKAERLLSRIGHSMLFDPSLSTIFILAGQRGQLYHSDLWSIKLSSPSSPPSSEPLSSLHDQDQDQLDHDGDGIERDGRSTDAAFWRAGAVVPSLTPTILSTTLLCADYARTGGPPGGFTQRASIDVASGEWTVLTGLVMTKRGEEASEDVWTRDREGRWERTESRGEGGMKGRYASQVVYDPLRKEHYVFGGHDPKDESRRLNDFWRLKVVRPSGEEALRMARFLVRKQRFNEMCRTQPTIVALTYLQTTVSEVVDHTDEAEASAFRACMAQLLVAPAANNVDSPMDDIEPDEEDQDSNGEAGEGDALTPEIYKERHGLFELLLDLFPDNARQPRERLADLAAPRWDQMSKGRFG